MALSSSRTARPAVRMIPAGAVLLNFRASQYALPLHKIEPLGPSRGRPAMTRVSRFVMMLAFAGLLAGCAITPRAPVIQPSPGLTVAAVAESLVGTPYRFGGDTGRGFDCSGLAVYAYERAGIAIPRTASEQKRAAWPVPLRDLSPGDLLFFRIDSRHVDHVGIYVGDDRFIHAPRPGERVSYGTLADRFYRRHLVSAGRFWR